MSLLERASLSLGCWSVIAAMALGGCAVGEPTLSTGRDITPPASFAQALGTMPVNLATTPDGRYAVTTDVGYRVALHLVRLKDGRSAGHVEFPNKSPKDDPNPVAKTNGLYYGLAIAGGGGVSTLYAAQGANDSVAVIAITPGAKGATLTQREAIQTRVGDFPAGLAIDNRHYLYVANQACVTAANPNPLENAGSIAIYDTNTRAEVGRYTFKDSFFGTSNFPLALAVMPDGKKLYVASERDSAVYCLDTSNAAAPVLLKKIATGTHPSALLFSGDHSRLFVANADSDTVSIVDTATDAVVQTIALRPDVARDLPGATPLGLALSPDETQLYVALADMNAVAVVSLGDNTVRGYIPTAWYPTALTVTAEKKLLVVSAKGNSARVPNASPRHSPLLLLEGNAQLLEIPAGEELQKSTAQVLANNHYDRMARPIPEPLASITRKSGKITHVVYIIKENRTYDQVLGDMPEGNGDAKLCLFPQAVTPNQHALARRFGVLDNLYACGEVSGDGWNWSTESMANPYVVRNVPYSYSGRGRKFDFEGTNNDYPTGGLPLVGADGKALSSDTASGEEAAAIGENKTARKADWRDQPPPAGQQDFPAVPDVAQAPGGHLWDLAAAHGVPFRNYGFFLGAKKNYPTVPGLQPGDHNLAGKSDIDFPRFILEFPDSDAPALLAAKTRDPAYLTPITSFGKFRAGSRYSEWKREFDLMLAQDASGGAAPALMMLRLPCDHTHGAKPGTRTTSSFVADNDFAVGQVVEAISHSPIWEHTAIFIIEDDAQDGPDHVDCHRTTGYVISPYLAAGVVHHQYYNTNSMLRTMEVLLDLPPMTQYDATATLIGHWTAAPGNAEPYVAVMAEQKYFAQHNPPKTAALSAEDRRLAEASEKMDFSREDAADAQTLNEIIWKSIKGAESAMPAPRTIHLLSAGLTIPQKDDDDDD